jgi:hypothetical protein
MEDPQWDPNELFSPQTERLPKMKSLADDIPIAKAKRLVVDVPVGNGTKAEVFIDDTTSLAVDLPGSANIKRMEGAALLAIHTVARPPQQNEPLPRHPMAAENKFLAEAGAEETKMVLGWLMNFRELKISLPFNKHEAWTRALREFIDNGVARAKELESTIGRMIHVAQVLPEIHHFLNRLRCLHRRAKNRRSIKVPESCAKDCELLIRFLDMAKSGISMNLLAYCLPDRVYRSDSCPHGLGGYSDQGYAWRYYLPEELLYRASNNLLEHIASIITVWIDIIAGRINRSECILSLTDSSTSEGWAHKSNFDVDPIDCEVDPIEAEVREEVCRHFALLCIENGIRHLSQWFPGKQNDVSDALSRDRDRSDEVLTIVLRTFVPEQMPDHFEIVPLPKQIASWLTSLLLKLPVKKQLQERPTTSKLGRGEDGSCTLSRSDATTPFSMDSTKPAKLNSWEPLPWLCERGDIRDALMIPWLKQQSEIPFHMWLRPSGRRADPTLPETMMANLAAFYQGSTDPLETETRPRNNRKPSPSAC